MSAWKDTDPCPLCERPVWDVTLGGRCECNGTDFRREIYQLQYKLEEIHECQGCADCYDGPSDEQLIDKAYPMRPGFTGS